MLMLLALCFAHATSQSLGDWLPKTAPWKERMDYRYEQVRRIENSQERWDATMNLAITGLLVPNFTETGFLVAPTPPEVHEALNESLRAGFDTRRPEHKVDQISGDRPDFVSLGRKGREAMAALRPLHEAWSGMKLVDSTAYGLRLYKPGNTLRLHTDRMETHVVSSIVHVDHQGLTEPWPLVIESLDGLSREVSLEPGQMLFYESAKCIHGRPRPMVGGDGSYYTSLFIHYRPHDWNVKNAQARAIAERSFDAPGFHLPPDKEITPLRLTGTGYYEPSCKHGWCDLAPVWPPPAESAEVSGGGGGEL